MSPGVLTALFAYILAGYVTILAVPWLRYLWNRSQGYKAFFSTLAIGYAMVEHVGVCVGQAASPLILASGFPLPRASDMTTFAIAWTVAIDAVVFLLTSGRRLRRRAAKDCAWIHGDTSHLLAEARDRDEFVGIWLEGGRFYIGQVFKAGAATGPDASIEIIAFYHARYDESGELEVLGDYRKAMIRADDVDPEDVEDEEIELVSIPKHRIISAELVA